MAAQLPLVSDPVWGKIISGSTNPSFSHLAVKMTVKKVQMGHKTGKSIAECAAELRGVFEKNCTAPNIKKDIEAL